MGSTALGFNAKPFTILALFELFTPWDPRFAMFGWFAWFVLWGHSNRWLHRLAYLGFLGCLAAIPFLLGETQRWENTTF